MTTKDRVWHRIMLDMALADLESELPDNIKRLEQVGTIAVPIPVLRHVIDCYHDWRER